MGDPRSEVTALEKDIMRTLDDPYGNCVNKCLKRLEDFSGMRPTRKSKPAADDEEEGETAEYEGLDEAQEEIERALGGVTVPVVEDQINMFFNDAEMYWRQHSLKIRQALESHEFQKDREEALQRNKDLKEEIKKWRKKSEYIVQAAYETQEMFELAAQGKPIDKNMSGAGKDAIWAEVFATQENQKDKAQEALKMMQRMNEQADECNAEMQRQTEKFKENITAAEEVREGLKEGMAKLAQISGGLAKDPIFCFCCIVALVMFAGSMAIFTGTWAE